MSNERKGGLGKFVVGAAVGAGIGSDFDITCIYMNRDLFKDQNYIKYVVVVLMCLVTAIMQACGFLSFDHYTKTMIIGTSYVLFIESACNHHVLFLRNLVVEPFAGNVT